MADIPSHATTVDEEMHKSPLASTEAIPVLLTDANVKKHRNIRGDSYRFAACLFCMLLSGWYVYISERIVASEKLILACRNDGSTGALIPTLEKHFSINYVTVSTVSDRRWHPAPLSTILTYILHITFSCSSAHAAGTYWLRSWQLKSRINTVEERSSRQERCCR